MKFRKAMLGQDKVWHKTLVRLDCEQSESSDPKDKELVFDVIRRTIGFPLLNSLVMRVLEKWLVARFLPAQREAARASADYPRLLQTVVEVVEAFQNRRSSMRGISREYPDSLASMHTLAGLYREQGRLEEATAVCAECLRTRERMLGAEHVDTLASKKLLANLGSYAAVEGHIFEHSDDAGAEACLSASLIFPGAGSAHLSSTELAPSYRA